MARLSLTFFALIACVQAATAQDQPVKLSITSLKAGQELTGTVEVSVKADVPEGKIAPSTAYVGLGGGTWQKMERVNATQWSLKVDTTMVPNGEQSLLVITENKRIKSNVKVVLKNPLKVFFADLHSHTSYSDGTLLPVVAHDYARNVANLDVFCLTDHLEYVDDAEWLDTREVAWDANDEGEFVVIPGLEWTKEWGHINIYDPKTRHWPSDPTEFYKAAADAGVVTKFNHPGDGTKSHSGLAYSKVGDQTVQMMEVRRPEEEKAFIRALNAGWHIAPEGSDDTHSANWGNVRSWTGIRAPGLSKLNILDALANRRLFSSLDRNCRLAFRLNDARMGDIVSDPVTEVQVYVRVGDPDDGDFIAKLELIEDGEVVASEEPQAQAKCWELTMTPEAGKHFYYVRLTQADGNMLWSAPIWVTVSGS